MIWHQSDGCGDERAVTLPNTDATSALGRELAAALLDIGVGAVIALEGELGAGKTTFARALIRALGHDGPVVSPTYTLMEPYSVAGRQLWHLDLYRLGDPQELDFLGVRDLSAQRDWLVVEWPERGIGYLPTSDLKIALTYVGAGRSARFTTATGTGEALLNRSIVASNKYGDKTYS